MPLVCPSDGDVGLINAPTTKEEIDYFPDLDDDDVLELWDGLTETPAERNDELGMHPAVLASFDAMGGTTTPETIECYDELGTHPAVLALLDATNGTTTLRELPGHLVDIEQQHPPEDLTIALQRSLPTQLQRKESDVRSWSSLSVV